MNSYPLSVICYPFPLSRIRERGLGGEGLRGRLRIFGFLLLLLVLAAPALAQAPAVERRQLHPDSDVAREAISQLRSPYCPGLMLEVCPSGQAEMLRDSIRMFAQQGMSAHQIVEWMLATHGEEWRAIPKRSGAGLWAWLLPPLALLAGLGLVAAKLHSLRSRQNVPAEKAPPLSEDERQQLAAALREWESENEVNA